jgi:hypothetical protein
MAYKDEENIWHVASTDTWSAWGRSHIDFCPKCRLIMGGPPYTPEEWEAYAKSQREHGVAPYG